MDRLGRDAAEQIALRKRFRSGKVGLVAIAQQIDLATPHGRAMAQIGAVFNELERTLIAERTTEALAELRQQGRATEPCTVWLEGRRRLSGTRSRRTADARQSA
jgi:DNA invertase Pin-like site-specific DNA recombinase